VCVCVCVCVFVCGCMRVCVYVCAFVCARERERDGEFKYVYSCFVTGACVVNKQFSNVCFQQNNGSSCKTLKLIKKITSKPNNVVLFKSFIPVEYNKRITCLGFNLNNIT